jgi:hypothetical protein
VQNPDVAGANTLSSRQNQPRSFLAQDKSLADLDNLPDPKDLAEDIVENIEAGLNNFRTVLAALGKQ